MCLVHRGVPSMPRKLTLSFIDGEVKVSHVAVCQVTLNHQQLGPWLSQPGGRSLSGQCDFLPPDCVVMEALHRPRLWVLPSEISILIRNIVRSLQCPFLWYDAHLSPTECLVTFAVSGMWGLSLVPPLLF